MQATVRSSNGSKYFSLGQTCVVEKVEDTGEVTEDDVDAGCSGAVVMKAEIIAVIGNDRSCSTYSSKASITII